MDLSIYDLAKMTDVNLKFNMKTSTFVNIQKMCEDSLNYSMMVGINGEAGYGKTSSLEYFKERNNQIIFCSVEKSQTTKAFYRKIIESLGYNNLYEGAELTSLVNTLVYILNSDNIKKLLIIDEAGKLSPVMLMYLQDIRNRTYKTTGIILSGPNYFKTRLQKWDQQNKEGIPEFKSRIQSWLNLKKPSKDEMVVFCQNHGVLSDINISQLIKNKKDFRQLENAIITEKIKVIRYIEDKKIKADMKQTRSSKLKQTVE